MTFQVSFVAAVAAVFAMCAESMSAGVSDAKADLVVRGGRLFDGTGAPSRPLGAIVVRGGRIEAVLPPGAPVPEATRTIDAADCTVLPGLFDLHVHIGAPGGMLTGGPMVTPEEHLEQHLACGVTQVLDLHGDASTIFDLRERSRDSTAMARLAVAGGAFTTPGGHGTQFGVPANDVSSREDVDQRFAALLPRHPDAIKAIVEHGEWGGLPEMPALSGDLLDAIAARAKSATLPLFVHVWTRDEALLAARSGARALAHGVFADRIDPELIGALKTSGTAYVATLSVVLASRRTLAGKLPYDRELAREVLHPDLAVALCDPDASATVAVSPMARMDGDVESRVFANLRDVAAAGIEIGIGTDAGNPLVPHGVSVPLEVTLHVEAGLSPAQALRAATLGSARILGVAGERGSIEPGKVADLVLVIGDASVDIGDLWNVRDVVRDGVPVDRGRIVARNRERARAAVTKVAGTTAPAELDDFEDGDLVSAWGGTWTAWSDRVAPGGKSDAQVDVVASDRGKALRITGTLTKDFQWGSWAGATLQFDREKKVVIDASAYRGLRLRARGTERPASITVQCAAVKDFNVFSTSFAPTKDWSEIDVPFEKLRQIGFGKSVAWTSKDLTGLTIDARNAFGSEPVLGDFALEIDWIRLY